MRTTMKSKFLLATLFILVGAGCARTPQPVTPTTNSTSVVVPTPVPSSVPLATKYADWQTFTNVTHQFSFKYPTEIKSQDTGTDDASYFFPTGTQDMSDMNKASVYFYLTDDLGAAEQYPANATMFTLAGAAAVRYHDEGEFTSHKLYARDVLIVHLSERPPKLAVVAINNVNAQGLTLDDIIATWQFTGSGAAGASTAPIATPPQPVSLLGAACGGTKKIKDTACGHGLYCKYGGNYAGAAGVCTDGLDAATMWQSYTNTAFGYGFKFPLGLTVTEQAPESVIITDAYNAETAHGFIATGESLSGLPSASEKNETIVVGGVSGVLYHRVVNGQAVETALITLPHTNKTIEFQWNVDENSDFVFYTILKTWQWTN